MARDVMTPAPSMVDVSTSAAQLVALFSERRYRHLLVTEEGRLAGVISERDVLHLFGEEAAGDPNYLAGLRAGDLMSKKTISIPPTRPVREMIGLLVSNAIHCLPVVEEEHPIGIITATDLFLTLEQALERAETVKSC